MNQWYILIALMVWLGYSLHVQPTSCLATLDDQRYVRTEEDQITIQFQISYCNGLYIDRLYSHNEQLIQVWLQKMRLESFYTTAFGMVRSERIGVYYLFVVSVTWLGFLVFSVLAICYEKIVSRRVYT